MPANVAANTENSVMDLDGGVCMRRVSVEDSLVLRMPRRMVTQYSIGDNNQKVLQLFYGDKEICFDEPELFAFGETLAKQSIFRAGDAQHWGQHNNWAQIAECLDVLIDQEIIAYVGDAEEEAPPMDRLRPSPLAPAQTSIAQSWDDCETITRDLTGHSIERGYLEMIVPVFRVAHIYRDSDQRQVGEANVFPPALRLEAPTEWLTCTYSGTRHMVDRPMNATALKAMLVYWPQMMVALQQIRSHFFDRFPDAQEGWTVGRVERLATMVLSVVTLPLVRAQSPVANGTLHPALSSLFRVTDGLRMAMHQMLFVPIGEPTRSADAPVNVEDILDYTERNYSFHSETGVCAGPKHMVREFLSILLEGAGPEKFKSIELAPDVSMALAHVDEAFEYGLLGLQVYGALFSFWPAMTRCYQEMADVVEEAVAAGQTSFVRLKSRLDEINGKLKRASYLGSEVWRMNREDVYADMYDKCGEALADQKFKTGLTRLLANTSARTQIAIADEIAKVIADDLGCSGEENVYVKKLSDFLSRFAVKTQAVLDVSCNSQTALNRVLARRQPSAVFTAANINTHNLLQGNVPQRLPFLLDEVESLFGLNLSIDRHDILVRASTRQRNQQSWPIHSAGAVPAEQRADAHT